MFAAGNNSQTTEENPRVWTPGEEGLWIPGGTTEVGGRTYENGAFTVMPLSNAKAGEVTEVENNGGFTCDFWMVVDELSKDNKFHFVQEVG